MPKHEDNRLERLFGSKGGQRSIKPLWAVGDIQSDSDEVEKDILKWAAESYEIVEDEAEVRQQNMFDNVALYMSRTFGGQSLHIFKGSEVDPRGTQSTRRIRINHLHEMTESHIASIASSRPAISVLPSGSDEYSDKIAAKTAKTVIESIWYDQNIDNLFRRVQRSALICGEGFILIKWDPQAGPKHPASKEADRLGIKEVDRRDEEGNILETEHGKRIKLPTDQRIGEVCYERLLSWDVFKEPVEYGKVEDWIMHREYVNIEKLKAQYPKKVGKIKDSAKDKVFNLNTLSQENAGERVLVLTLYHRSTPELPNGLIIKMTPDVILEKKDIEFDSLNTRRLLPIISLKDGEIDGLQYGWPLTVFETGKGLQQAINNITSIIIRNHSITAPKWVMPIGSTSDRSLGNGPVIIKYDANAGPAPQLIAPPPLSQELFLFRDKLKEDLQQITGVHGVSRGEPPGSIRAGVALQFLEEQEIKRRTSMIAKYNDFIVEAAVITLAIAGDMYTDDDGRVAKMFGQFNSVRLKKFQKADLTKYYDIHVQRSSALPESKAAKIQLLLEISQQRPNLLTDEQFLDMIEIPRTERLFNLTTAALDAAESDWEDFIEGEELPAPEEWYDLITYWKVFSKNMQSKMFRTEVPEEIREQIKSHLAALEFLMINRGAENPIFAQQITVLSQFPRIYKPSIEEIQVLGGLAGQPQLPPELGADAGPGNLGSAPGPVNEIVGEDLL
jgi:hypothetical protein